MPDTSPRIHLEAIIGEAVEGAGARTRLDYAPLAYAEHFSFGGGLIKLTVVPRVQCGWLVGFSDFAGVAIRCPFLECNTLALHL